MFKCFKNFRNTFIYKLVAIISILYFLIYVLTSYFFYITIMPSNGFFPLLIPVSYMLFKSVIVFELFFFLVVILAFLFFSRDGENIKHHKIFLIFDLGHILLVMMTIVSLFFTLLDLPRLG